jgi:hypothetical protein
LEEVTQQLNALQQTLAQGSSLENAQTSAACHETTAYECPSSDLGFQPANQFYRMLAPDDMPRPPPSLEGVLVDHDQITALFEQ